MVEMDRFPKAPGTAEWYDEFQYRSANANAHAFALIFFTREIRVLQPCVVKWEAANSFQTSSVDLIMIGHDESVKEGTSCISSSLFAMPSSKTV